MAVVPLSRVLIAAENDTHEWRASLEAAGFEVINSGLGGIDPAEVERSQAIILVVGSRTLQMALAIARRWRIELGEHYVPLIWLAEAGISPALGLDAGVDVVLPNAIAHDQLIAQLKALLRLQHLNARLTLRAAEAKNINQRLQQAYQQIESDLELTRRIHRGFLPKLLPEVGQMRAAVCYRPRTRIGGDFYDAVRLDEHHAMFYVADAMGRGTPANSLLSVFVKRSIQAKEILGQSYRLIPPGEVLVRLNKELVALNLSEPAFVTMSYVLFNCFDGTVSFARAAHPHILYVPTNGTPEYWYSTGTLLGVFEAEFPMQHRQMQPGDKLILYTDGVHPPGSGPGADNDPLPGLVVKHRALGVQPFVDCVSRDLLDIAHQSDDFTLLAIEFRQPS